MTFETLRYLGDKEVLGWRHLCLQELCLTLIHFFGHQNSLRCGDLKSDVFIVSQLS
jgi:hypothetical protein